MEAAARPNTVPNQGTKVSTLKAVFLHSAFGACLAATSGIYLANKILHRRTLKKRPLADSLLVKAQGRFPIIYEMAMLVQNLPLFDKVYDILPPLKGRVLQVGCGTGLLNRRLRKSEGLTLVNLDPNRNALELGRRFGRFQDFHVGGIDARTPFEEGEFDTVLFARSFHHVRNHRRALKESARVLRNGGTLIISDIVVLNPDKRAAGEVPYMANSSIDGVIWRFSRQNFEPYLRSILPDNMQLESVEVIRAPHVTNYNFMFPQADVVATIRRVGV